MPARQYDDDWDQDKVSNFDELYPIAGMPTDPRVWDEPLDITSSSLPDGAPGAAYTAVLQATGGQLPYSFILKEGSVLPTGLALSTNGQITGTPTAAGDPVNFTVVCTDVRGQTDEQSFGIQVKVPPPVFGWTTSESLGTVNASAGTFSVTLGTYGQEGGVSFSETGTSDWTLSSSGVASVMFPTGQSGSYSFTATATDGSTPPQTITRTFTLQVSDGPPPLVITTPAAQSRTSSAFTLQLVATGGTGITYDFVAGSSLPGATLSPSGLLSGVVSPGSYAFTIEATDDLLRTVTKLFTLAVTYGDTNPDPNPNPNPSPPDPEVELVSRGTWAGLREETRTSPTTTVTPFDVEGKDLTLETAMEHYEMAKAGAKSLSIDLAPHEVEIHWRYNVNTEVRTTFGLQADAQAASANADPPGTEPEPEPGEKPWEWHVKGTRETTETTTEPDGHAFRHLTWSMTQSEIHKTKEELAALTGDAPLSWLDTVCAAPGSPLSEAQWMARSGGGMSASITGSWDEFTRPAAAAEGEPSAGTEIIHLPSGGAVEVCLRRKDVSAEALKQRISRTFVLIKRTSDNDPSTPDTVEATAVTLTIEPGQKTSTTGTSPRATTGKVLLIGKPADDAGTQVTESLLPIDLAPEVLASNGDFDEGDKRSIQTEPEGAKADNSNHSMIALSDSVDGRVKVGDLITEDLHPGWFGLKPGILPDDFFNGAEVTIRKVSKQDTETDAPESGRVRMFATWGDKLEREIIPDNQNLPGSSANSSEPKNLVGVVYGSSKTVPAGANFWMEGVTPGKITLEFRIKKGSTDVKHEQTFEIYNKWTRDQWLAVVRDEIYLDSFTSAGGGAKNGISSPGSDISKYTVANDFLPNRPHIYSVYEYYAKLQEQNSNYYWTGLAKLAGGPVYAGMSDCQNGRDGIAIGSVGLFSASLLKSIQDVLIDANINIYNDLAYQFVAYRIGGIKSIKHLNQRGEVTLPLYDAWKQIADGSDVTGASQILLQREQRDILLKTYADLDSLGYGSISWLFSVLCESPILGDPDFRSVVPSGSLSNYNNRWLWITDSMWPSWTSKNSSERKALAASSLRSHASNYVWIPILR